MYYIGRRDNSPFQKPYYVALGELTKDDIRRKKDIFIGTIDFEPYSSLEEYKAALKDLENMGYKVKYPKKNSINEAGGHSLDAIADDIYLSLKDDKDWEMKLPKEIGIWAKEGSEEYNDLLRILYGENYFDTGELVFENYKIQKAIKLIESVTKKKVILESDLGLGLNLDADVFAEKYLADNYDDEELEDLQPDEKKQIALDISKEYIAANGMNYAVSDRIYKYFYDFLD